MEVTQDPGGGIVMLVIGIGLAGCAGAVARFWLGGYIARKAGSAFPWGTFVINITGALLLGLLAGVGMGRGLIPPLWRTILGTGLMGAYTTFSTWSLETDRLLRSRSYLLAGTNVLLSAVAGILAAGVGLFVGKHL